MPAGGSAGVDVAEPEGVGEGLAVVGALDQEFGGDDGGVAVDADGLAGVFLVRVVRFAAASFVEQIGFREGLARTGDEKKLSARR